MSSTQSKSRDAIAPKAIAMIQLILPITAIPMRILQLMKLAVSAFNYMSRLSLTSPGMCTRDISHKEPDVSTRSLVARNSVLIP